jgi:hypothetical protein
VRPGGLGATSSPFVLTLFWGGPPPGQRPAWLFTGPENDPLGGVGVGKSACVQLLGDHYLQMAWGLRAGSVLAQFGQVVHE